MYLEPLNSEVMSLLKKIQDECSRPRSCRLLPLREACRLARESGLLHSGFEHGLPRGSVDDVPVA